MPEGDSLHRAARRLQALVGERVEVETPNPRAQIDRLDERLNGRRLLAAEAVGKNLLLRFEGGFVLRGAEREAVLWGGPVLELHTRGVARLGPDILADPPDFERMLANLRREDQRSAVGDALLDQRVIAGIGNVWKAEALWLARLSPWARLGAVGNDELLATLRAAHALMRGSVETGRQARRVYRHAGRPCPRCGTPIRSRGQGDANRTAYWCPACQEGEPAPGA